MIDRDLHHAIDDYPAPGRYTHRARLVPRLGAVWIDRSDPKTGGSTPAAILDVGEQTALLDDREMYDELAETLDEYGFDVTRRRGDQ